MLELLDLSTKDGKNLGGGVTGLELCHQRVREKVRLRLLLILLEGRNKDGLQIGSRRGCGRYLRHDDSREENCLRVQCGIWVRTSSGDRYLAGGYAHTAST